jgi:hypothetical protein
VMSANDPNPTSEGKNVRSHIVDPVERRLTGLWRRCLARKIR